MSGIIVGIDGSAHSQRALEWAVREAALRQVPLNVITVYQAEVGSWGGAVAFPADHALAGKARDMAREATDKALALAGDARPARTDTAVSSGTS